METEGLLGHQAIRRRERWNVAACRVEWFEHQTEANRAATRCPPRPIS
jgi:hypothetical protein